MKVLLLGSNGMLGQAIKKCFSTHGNIELITVARQNADYIMDLTDDAAISKCFAAEKPEVVINAAAVVDLRGCEEDKLNAYLVNARLCSIIAEQCKMYGTYFVHISTDNYYSGDGKKLHTIDDSVCLKNEYARTKYIGECLTQAYDNSIVLRTNIVGFRHDDSRKTFLEWVIDAIKANEGMSVFDDFYTSSMHTAQLAEILVDIIKLKPRGIFNVASAEAVSKKEFILAVKQELFPEVELSYTTASVRNLSGAARNDSLGLDVESIEALLGYKMPDLAEVIDSIKAEYKEA